MSFSVSLRQKQGYGEAETVFQAHFLKRELLLILTSGEGSEKFKFKEDVTQYIGLPESNPDIDLNQTLAYLVGQSAIWRRQPRFRYGKVEKAGSKGKCLFKSQVLNVGNYKRACRSSYRT